MWGNTNRKSRQQVALMEEYSPLVNPSGQTWDDYLQDLSAYDKPIPLVIVVWGKLAGTLSEQTNTFKHCWQMCFGWGTRSNPP